MDRISSISDFYPYAVDFHYVSFDLFDTILKRRFLRANEVHDTVSAYAQTLIGKTITHAASDITLSRWAAGSALKAQLGIDIQEPTAAMVWERLLCFEHGLGDEKQRTELAERIVAFEHALETRNLALVDGALELLQRLKAENKVLIAISDMYFGSKIIEEILENLGVLQYFDHVYVSAEINLTKQTGDLFRRVLHDLDILPHQMRHVGDNHHSDIAMAVEVGIPCVLCEQEHLLQLERPVYGKRDLVEEDVADIVKAHLFSVLFDVHERQASHIYFMGRDGCTINSFFTNWQSDLVREFLPAPTYSDIFLNRVLTSWANVDFSSQNWLEQAVGIAFWLKEGKASGEELSALLGISVTPAALGTQQLVSTHDTARVVWAYRDAGLEPEIKASIIEKCIDVERYLDSEGFFAHKAVAVSDVGYSGSVLRALNRLLLNRSPEACVRRVPPATMLHLIATYSNYEVNRIHAMPTVQFSNRAILPINRLPEGLRETFAWIEYFFKHPTLRPVLELVETSGKVRPLLMEDDQPAEPLPSQRLQKFAVERDEDIALLWMAATDNFAPLTDGILDRFAKPDAKTIAQMRDEIFELDSIEGTRRSVVLEVPGAQPDVVARAAIAGDYWVAGSVAASAVAGHSDLLSEAPVAKRSPRGFRGMFKRSTEAVKDRLISIRGFDPEFYRSFYPDLRQFTTRADLLRHYANHGHAEGRLISSASLRAQLQAQFGTLPDDFNAEAYRYYNPDLAAIVDSPERALDHYMRIGRQEGRFYGPRLDQLIREFEVLRCTGVLELDANENKRVAAGETTLSVFLGRHSLKPGPWIDQLEVAEFRAMHSQWCGPVSTRAECIVALCERGLSNAPSLSLRHQFDPDFYRAQIGEDDGASPEYLFRHYISVGSMQGLASSEATELLRLWGNSEFPACFDWMSYRAAAGAALANGDRIEVLKAFVDDLAIDRLQFISREKSAQFVEWLAVRSWHHNSQPDEARRLFQAALDRGGSSGLLHQWLGDLEDAAGHTSAALDHYRASIKAPSPNRWSYLNAASLLLNRGDYKGALACLEEGRSVWQETVPWRTVYDRAMHDWSKACGARQSFASGSFDEPDKLVCEIMRRIPAPAALSAANEGVLVFTGRPHAGALSEHLLPPNVTVLGLDAIDRGEFLAPMLRHGPVIFHEVPFTYRVLQASLTARSLGRQTVSWLGNLVRWNDWPLNEGIWDGTGRDLSLLTAENLSELGLIARYCDVAVTSIPGCTNAFKKLAPSTPLQEVCDRQSGLRRVSDGDRVALVLFDAETSPQETDGYAHDLVRCLEADARLHLIISENFASSRPFRDMVGRWSALEAAASLADISSLISTTDLVVQFVSRNRPPAFAAWQCAAKFGVPAILVPVQERHNKTSALTTWNDDIAFTEGNLSHAIISSLKRQPLPVSINDEGCMALPKMPRGRPVSEKKRILFVNAWAPPQVIGGASRVMKDNIDYILDNHGEEFEIAMFAGDDYRDHFGNFTVDAYRGVPVFRVALPPEGNPFWQPRSSLAASYFANILESFQPDLVHIHCLQRLTASIAESCQARGVPYFVTLHDAWWLSDFPFLANEDGLAAPAHVDYHHQQRKPQFGILASTLRAEGVRRALLGARRRLAVSKSFAQLYAACGIPCDVIENGNSKIGVSPRISSLGPVQICHLGGLERHKGAFLVEAALRNNEFGNIEFTMVDLTQDGSATSRSVWGNTLVNVIGKMNTEELGDFYARMHVLVAPSTCQESFGLVTREALAHGLWVIASDRGAMSEPICEGVNGYRVNVSNAEELAQVFAAINSNPDRYRASPMVKAPQRHADDQSRELVELYRKTPGHASRGLVTLAGIKGNRAS